MGEQIRTLSRNIQMVQRLNPTPEELVIVGEWITRLQLALERGDNWGYIKWCLDALSKYRDRKVLEEVAITAEIQTKELCSRYYDSKQYVDTSDRDLLKRWLGVEEGKLSELLKGVVLSIPQTHIKIDKLLGGAEMFLKPEEWAALYPLEQDGLNEAASCLLSNCYTSAEFITLRTAESLLRRWYEKETGNKLERQMWGEILEELNELYPKKAERPKELSLLDYLRGRRNEIAHPEAMSSPEEATATFLNVIRVCQAITHELLH